MSENAMKKIGLVGGIGPASTVDYYLGLIEKTRTVLGKTRYPEIVIDSVDLNEATEYFELEQWDKSADLMVRSVENLARAGAEIAAITANTEHIVWERMKAGFKIPVISIVDAVVEEILSRQYKKILVLGTEFTMKSGLYNQALESAGIKTVAVTQEDCGRIGGLIYPKLENGIVDPLDKKEMLGIINNYLNFESVDAVLLGCTELPLMIHEENLALPLLNSTQIHIDAIFRAANR